jgi:hypothetical protein
LMCRRDARQAALRLPSIRMHRCIAIDFTNSAQSRLLFDVSIV